MVATGRGTIPPRSHIAGFVTELAGIARDFKIQADPATAAGSLEITGDRPVALAALRFTYNLQNEALITAIPVADLDRKTMEACRYLPWFVDGGGYATGLTLLNTTDSWESGLLRIMDANGHPLPVSGRYSLSPYGVFRLQSGGSAPATSTGWVQIIPDAGTSLPFAMGLFSFKQNGELLSLSSIPATPPTTHARVHVDRTSWHDTGVAVGNPSAAASRVDLKVFRADGTAHPASAGELSLRLPANGHIARFGEEFFQHVPRGFTGTLDLTSTVPFVALTMRSLLTFRNYEHRMVFSAADITREASPDAFFPHVADGGAYSTDLLFLNPGLPLRTTLRFIGRSGAPLPVASPDNHPSAR
jgi:hypothetical protein